MIISLHIHKCAGSSFKVWLGQTFGNHSIASVEQGFACDSFADSMMQSVKPNHDIIHGHIKTNPWFSSYPPNQHDWITWIRDPLKRIASEYLYINRHFYQYRDRIRWATYFADHDKLTFADYCFLPDQQNFISKHFDHGGFSDIEKFKFVGVSDLFDEEIRWLATYQYKSIIKHVPVFNSAVEDQKRQAEIDQVINDVFFKQKFRDYHSEDYRFYQYALDQRNKRVNG